MDNMQRTLGELTEELKELTKAVNVMQQQIKPLVEAYDSVLFGRKFLVGLAGVVGAIAVMGGAILWLVNYIRHG